MKDRKSTDRRTEIIQAAFALLPEVGADNLTHRMVAAKANVPLGSTTYYFSSLDELVHEALRFAADLTSDELARVKQRLANSDDVVATLCSMVDSYLNGHTHMIIWNELYTSASHRPELRPLARVWSEGLADILSVYMSQEAAMAVTMFIDGALIHALIAEELPDTAVLTAAIEKLAK